MISTRTDGAIIYVNAAFETLTGYALEDLVGASMRSLLCTDIDQPGFDDIRRALESGERTTGILHCLRRDGGRLPVRLEASPIRHDGAITHHVFGLHELHALEPTLAQLRFFAHHDDLTGLPNRRLLFDRMEQALARYRRYGEEFIVAFLDLNGFKCINDELGHAAGDELLKQVAMRLSASVRACDTVARYGGDEFVILLSDATDPDAAIAILERAQERLAQPLIVSGHSIGTTCCVGIAQCPTHGADASRLLDAADRAMYRMKGVSGGGMG